MSVRKYTGSVRRLRVVVAATALAVLVSGLYVPSAQASYGQQVRNMTAVAGAVTANDMAQQILGGATTVSNASFSGDQRQGGTVSGFDGIGFPTATILSTGLVSMERGLGYNSQPNCGYCPWLSGSAVAGPNWQKDTTYQFGTSGDSDLQGLISYMSPYIERSRTLDVATLQFDFVSRSGTVELPYIFASEKYRANWQDIGWIYPDKWNAAFYSAMGIWVNGVQCATVGPSNEPVTVNTVNHLRNTDYYRDNPVVTPYGESRYPTGFNGMTTVLTCKTHVKSGQLNHVKITVGDVGYSNYDSGVFMGTGSFIPDPPDPSKSTLVLDNRSAQVGSAITATASLLTSDGDPVDGVTVSFAKTNPSVSLSASSCVTGLSGQCNVTLNSDAAVSDQLWATVMLPAGVTQITGSPAAFQFTKPEEPKQPQWDLNDPWDKAANAIRRAAAVDNDAQWEAATKLLAEAIKGVGEDKVTGYVSGTIRKGLSAPPGGNDGINQGVAELVKQGVTDLAANAIKAVRSGLKGEDDGGIFSGLINAINNWWNTTGAPAPINLWSDKCEVVMKPAEWLPLGCVTELQDVLTQIFDRWSENGPDEYFWLRIPTRDGKFGQETEYALSQFKLVRGLPDEGRDETVDAATKAALYAELTPAGAPTRVNLRSMSCPTPVERGQSSGCVTELQALLKKQGFYGGTVDGLFGWGTFNAVIAFQGDRCLPVDGFVGTETKKALVDPNPLCHTGKTRVDRTIAWAVAIARDDKHGYSQVTRNGGTDYDCSSFLMTALRQAGYDVDVRTNTDNMYEALKNNHFTDVTDTVNKDTGAGLRSGDILLRTGPDGHAAIVNFALQVPLLAPQVQVTQATANNSSCTKDAVGLWSCGNPGDDNGYEIRVDSYETKFGNNQWYVMHDYDYVLRP